MKECQICGKGSIVRDARKKLRGNYNPTGAKRKYPNLQKTRLTESLPAYLKQRGFVAGARLVACTECIKRLSKGANPKS